MAVADYRVDKAAVARAEELIHAGTDDDGTEWSEADRPLQRLDEKRDADRDS